MRHLVIRFLIAVMVLPSSTYGQNYVRQRNEVLVINLASNALLAGVGATINKPAHVKWPTAFINGFLRGSLGGLVKYTAKSQTILLKNENVHFYAGINRLHYFLGHSLVMNAALGKRFLQTYYCNLYGIEFRIGLRDTQKVQARLSAATVFNAAWFGIRGFQFNFYKSLQFGQLYFDIRPSLSPVVGTAGFNCLAIETPPRGWNSLTSVVWPHELVHTYQNYDYFSLSAIYDRKLEPIVRKSKLLTRLGKYIVADYQTLFFETLYAVQPEPKYYRNYFEFEAQHFAVRSYVPRNP